ncbi:transcriptional regulator [Lactiplantibacillus plantarum]|uniref:transcriptional regulator n=1 Tax=Lactiplantibacillus plantarum TaxID=1590 RepID=UPI0009768628|nr:transcriptional regulator [Lactiplantibacillus plantarum]MBS0937651.1 XRE family transcriptional regulator [Lactiplantibacillus plantarum]MBS0944640.1 XRE family transcriptional regulator [Lactiplantibacillus plantarum]
MEIYSAIKDIAKTKEVSIYRIEHDLKLTNGAISKWDKSIPAVNSLQSVANYLGVTITFILDKSKER